ncbi:MAG TPA: proton-conducting transporter membrane subunit [Elusimicrobiota bacterium]|nr:proton-conducting transporter membrane subunit [Elusimicrobiota bacterium]
MSAAVLGGLLAPQMVLAAGVLGVLGAGMAAFNPKFIKSLMILAILGAFALAFGARPGAGDALIGLDGLGFSWQLVFYAAALPLAFLMAAESEVAPALVLGSLLGLGLLAVSANLLMLFIGLELMSLPAYLLVARSRGGAQNSVEAAIKYFFVGGAAGGLYLLGLALYYFTQKTMAFAGAASLGAQAGVALMGSAALFKVGAFPLHFWLPDVYEASDPELTGFLSTALKAGGILLLMRLAALSPAGPFARALPWFGAATMLFGAVLALRQERLQRLLAYSSMAHAGNIVLGVGAWAALGATPGAAVAVFFYLAAYLFMNNGAFSFLKASGAKTRADLRGLGARSPETASAFAILLLALGGVPPTAGFLAKLLIFWEAFKAHLYAPLLLAALGALLALGYYLALLKDLYFEDAPAAAPQLETGSGLAVLWTCAVPAAVLGVAPWILTYMSRLLAL